MTNPCVKYTTLNVTPPFMWNNRRRLFCGRRRLFCGRRRRQNNRRRLFHIKGGVTLRVVYLTQGLVTLPQLVIYSCFHFLSLFLKFYTLDPLFFFISHWKSFLWCLWSMKSPPIPVAKGSKRIDYPFALELKRVKKLHKISHLFTHTKIKKK